MSNDDEIAKLKKQIVGHIQQTYCGDTSDIEGQAGTDFCTYFVQTYSDKKDTLKAKFRKIEEDIRLALVWTPADCVDRVVEADPDDMPEFWVAPWQIGFTDGHSVKGMSKLVHILDIIEGFLSRSNPCRSSSVQGPRSRMQ